MPGDMPDRMPEDMPDRMPDRMPEDMLDRMPEDLPVTKCISVMVGITRSKVIYCQFKLSLLSSDFPLKFQRNLLRRKDFNWNQFILNSFEPTFSWFPFQMQKERAKSCCAQ